VLTRKELATALKLTPEALRKWERDLGAPLGDWLGWPLPDAVKLAEEWRAGNLSSRRDQPEAESLSQRLLAAKVRDTNAAARRKEIENAIKEGKLIDIDEAVREQSMVYAEVRAIIETLPDAIARDLPQDYRASGREIVRHEVLRALRKLASIRIEGSDGP
jgi:phage terminase Nu1 subunit (DNA packaging protein)